MAGGVRLLILNKKSIEQTMNDYITQWIGTCKMINMLRKGIKFSMQKVYFRKVIFNVDPIVNVLNALKNSNR